MKKRELLKLPEMQVTKTMKETVQQDVGYRASSYSRGSVWVPKFIWYLRAKRTEDVLEIAMFTREMIKEGTDYPAYRVFLHDGKYDTWDNRKGKWRTATIERLEYCRDHESVPVYYWYSDRGLWMADVERKVLLDYTDNERKDPMAAVQHWQSTEKNRTELDKIDAEMRLVPELPKDFGEWILTDGISQYIFYDAGRNVKEGYCTACKHTVPIEKPRYNQETTCPHCKRKVIYKSRKKSGYLTDRGYVGIIQKTAEGFVYRHFYVRVEYKNGDRINGGYWENIRHMYDRNFCEGNEFEFCQYKSTDMTRWCYKDYLCWNEKVKEYESVLYWRNLKKIFKGTCMEYSALELFARQRIRFFPEYYIEKYRHKKGIEQLVKCGFYKIVDSLLSPYGSMPYIDAHKTSARKILNLKKEYYRLLAGTNPTKKEFEITWEFQEVGILPKREDVAYLAEHGNSRNFAIYIRHTTEHKMMRYMKENLQSSKDSIRDYHDYLQMAAGLGYDLKDEWILFPKNLKERHDQYIEERREKDLQIQKAEDDKKIELFKETVLQRRWKELEMEKEGLFIKLPEEPSEIRTEGHNLHHCVSTYIDRMIGGKTCILFIRQKEEPNQSFYTMEVRDGKVIQCRGKNNCDMTEDVKELVEVFKKKKLHQLERIAC